MNLLVYALGVTGFFICGYAFLCGGKQQCRRRCAPRPMADSDRRLGIRRGKGFPAERTNRKRRFTRLQLFLFMLMVRMDVVATIPLGTLAERWKF